MMIRLSDREAAILLGATLMHWGVPFHRTAKHELTDDQQTTIDAASTKLDRCAKSASKPKCKTPRELNFQRVK